MDRKVRINTKKRVVVKVGSSSLSFANGRINLQRMEALATVLSELRKESYEIMLVSSGAVAVGGGILKIENKPSDKTEKQALASVGQSELIKIYRKFFASFDQHVAQVLLTKDGIQDEQKSSNAYNTLKALLKMKVVPIINENDAVSTSEIEFGDNDMLSANVAALTGADLLIILSDINGLYTADPRKNKDARLIPLVEEISPKMEQAAEGSASSFGTGGMSSKIRAVKVCRQAGIDTILANGKNPEILRDILKGDEKGTYFIAPAAE